MDDHLRAQTGPLRYHNGIHEDIYGTTGSSREVYYASFDTILSPDKQTRDARLHRFLAEREAANVEKKKQVDMREMHQQETYRRQLMDRREGESVEQQMQRQVHATTLLFAYQERVEARRRLRDHQEVLDAQKKADVVQGQITRRQIQLLAIAKNSQEKKEEFELKNRARQDARDRDVARELAREEQHLLDRRSIREQQHYHEEWQR